MDGGEVLQKKGQQLFGMKPHQTLYEDLEGGGIAGQQWGVRGDNMLQMPVWLHSGAQVSGVQLRPAWRAAWTNITL